MEGIIEELKKLIECCLLSSEVVDDRTIEQMVESRESDEFDAAWVASFQQVEGLVIPVRNTQLLAQLREQAFKEAYQKTGNSDIAAFVCDDFELMARAWVLVPASEWVAALRQNYSVGRFPCCIEHGRPAPLS